MTQDAGQNKGDLSDLSLHALRLHCAQESNRFFARQPYDPRFCFELFRRAAVESNQRAWEWLYDQYLPLVSGWVKRHPLSTILDEESDYFVNRAFEKLWNALTAEKFTRFADLKSVLRYLQMCVHSVMIDYRRGLERSQVLGQPVELDTIGTDDPEDGLTQMSDPGQEDLEGQVLAGAQADLLWQMLEARCKDERERKILYGSFVLALKPGEMCEQYPTLFTDVHDVYSLKENLLARLKRDQEIKLALIDVFH